MLAFLVFLYATFIIRDFYVYLYVTFMYVHLREVLTEYHHVRVGVHIHVHVMMALLVCIVSVY